MTRRRMTPRLARLIYSLDDVAGWGWPVALVSAVCLVLVGCLTIMDIDGRLPGFVQHIQLTLMATTALSAGVAMGEIVSRRVLGGCPVSFVIIAIEASDHSLERSNRVRLLERLTRHHRSRRALIAAVSGVTLGSCLAASALCFLALQLIGVLLSRFLGV